MTRLQFAHMLLSVSNKLTQKINHLETIKTRLDNEYQTVLDEANPLLNESTDEKLKDKTIDELTTLRQKLSSAKTHASDVYQHAYNAGYTKKSDEALELQGKIEAAYNKVTALIKEAEKARKLIQEINDKIAEIQREKAKITEEIKQKVDPLEQLIDTLKENNKN